MPVPQSVPSLIHYPSAVQRAWVRSSFFKSIETLASLEQTPGRRDIQKKEKKLFLFFYKQKTKNKKTKNLRRKEKSGKDFNTHVEYVGECRREGSGSLSFIFGSCSSRPLVLGLYIYLYNTTSELYSRARLYARIPAAIFHSPARNSLAQAKITSVRSSHGGGSQPVAFGERFFFFLFSLSSPPIYIYAIRHAMLYMY
jgi:hypothetical protein